jgi:dienelactone hydrolase
MFLAAMLPFAALAQNAPEPEDVTFRSRALLLRGFLWQPEGRGPFPAVILNHGSEANPGTASSVARFFNQRGYVAFFPHRRGHGRSADQARWVGDLLAEEEKRNGPEARGRLVVRLMEEQLQDQLAAITYVRSLPFVDPEKVATWGCSFGGIQTMLAAEAGFGLRAAVNFAGAAMNWERSAAVRERMLKAARSARIPVLLIQAENDYSTAPTKELSQAMREAGRSHRARIYPPFGTTNQEGHGFCGRGTSLWHEEVFGFLTEHMR